jgi:putative transposase
MIDRTHDLPIAKQARALNISRGKGARRDNVFVERLWRSVKYEEVYLRAYDTASEARASIGRIRALTAPPPITPTSPRCLSAWQPNPGRRSTYRRGNAVQTTGATSWWCTRY